MTLIKAILLFQIFSCFSCSQIGNIKDLKNFCSSMSDTHFSDYYFQNEQINKNFLESKNQKDIYSGVSRSVIEACYPFKNIKNNKNPVITDTKVVVKKSNYIKEHYSKYEIQILKALSDFKLGPRFHGCIIDEDQDSIYLIMEKLLTNLNSEEFMKIYKNFDKVQKLEMFLSLLKQVVYLYDQGYHNGDIKLDNMVINKDQSQFYIIDYGTSRPIDADETIRPEGTPHYASPNKLRIEGRERAKLVDDLYSLFMSFVTLEAEKNFDEIYQGTLEIDRKHKYSCYEKKLENNCYKVVRDNAVTVLVKNDFRSKTKARPDPKNELNFTDLTYLVFNLDAFELTGIKVIEIVEKEITYFKTILGFEHKKMEKIIIKDELDCSTSLDKFLEKVYLKKNNLLI